MKITKPGIYRGISDADYRADPCPSPSLTQSLCKILVERSPKHAWTECPRLNPHFERDDDTKFDVGNVAHRILLGRGKEIEVVRFPDWRKKEAQEARIDAAVDGKIAVLEHQFTQASDMASAALMQLKRHEDHDAFQNGAAEVMIAWQEDGIWFRSLIDWLHDDLRTVDDFKTSGMSMAPHVIGLRAQAAGWEIQAAFFERGLDILDPEGAGRRRYRFIAQETDKPHALTVMHMDESWMTYGRKKVQTAVDLWRRAIENNAWHGYTHSSVIPEYPGFKGKQWLERELSGEFESENDISLTMAG
jgi:PDDEXK-like domain of unknown function (DUF3799)